MLRQFYSFQPGDTSLMNGPKTGPRALIRTTLAAKLFVGALLLSTSPAHADFTVCNDTKSLTGVAIGYRDDKDWVMEGWWRIPAGVCAALIEGELSSRYFYLYAEDADTGGQWRGPVFMCTSTIEFKISGLKDCFARGYERTGFFEVDTGNQKDWQVRLTEAGQTKEDEEASK